MRVATVEVANWADVGPLYETRHWEDYSLIVRRPDPATVVIVHTVYGEIFVYPRRWSNDVNGQIRAQRLADRVSDAKEINPEHWQFWRNEYGSAAYEDEMSLLSPSELADR